MVNLPRSERHNPGLGRLCYSPDGAVLYTAGNEGFLRVFSAIPEDDNNDQLALIEYHEDTSIYTMDASMESLVTGSEDGKAALFDHSSREFASLVTESPMGLSVRGVKFSPNGHRIAIASDALEVKVIDVRDIQKIQILVDHTKSVRAVTWSPDGQLITTSSSDGTIRVWDVSDPNEAEPSCIQVIDGLLGEEDAESEVQCQAIWHPSGRYFVVGTKSHEIAVISKDTWAREGEFAQDGHTGAITTLAFSPNGRYLCSTATDNTVRVWDSASRKVIQKVEDLEARISDLAWRPGAGSNTIAFIDNQGYVSRWHDAIPQELAHPNDAPPAGAKNKEAAIEEAKNRSRALGLEDDGLDLDIAGSAPAGDIDLEADDFIEDDEDDGVYQSRYSKGLDADGLPPPLSSKHRSSVVVASSSRPSSLVKGQEPFQSGATPFKEGRKEKRRYLTFNSIGVIDIIERDSHNIVTVDFHDHSAHTSTHFDDFTKFNLGCLGHNGAVYALSGGKTAAGVLQYKPFSSWESTEAGWSYDFPSGEEVKALALGGAAASLDEDGAETLDDTVGSGKIVVATSQNYLRFFSGAGSQTYLMNLGEQIVTLAAGREWLIVVHRPHELIIPGFQDLNYTIMDLDTYEVVQRGKIPLPKGAILQWVGFSEEQVPYMYDSTGMLSALDRARRPMQARWVPMLDTNTLARREGKQESYWPVGVHDAFLMCVILKGGDKYPYFPTPITSDLDIKLPMLNMGDPAGELEAKLLQTTILVSNARDSLPSSTAAQSDDTWQIKAKVQAYEVDMDKSILKLVQLACKNEKHQQAVDLAKMLNTGAALGGAIKIAQLYSISGLTQRFQALKDAKDGIHGSSGYDEQQKREGKYAHLVDNRTIPDSTLQINGVNKAHQQGFNPLSMPFNAAPRPKKTAKSVFSDATLQQKPKSKPVQRDSYIADGNGVNSDDDGVRYDDNEEYANDMRQESVMPQDSMPPSSMPVRAPFNPFAKSVQMPPSSAMTASSQAGPSNPFAKRSQTSASGNALKKTGSFFDRVDASNGLSSTGAVLTKPTSAGGKQSTLFGLPPAAPKEAAEKKSNRGRKRKSDITNDSQGGDDDDCVEVTSVRKLPKNIKSFFGGKAAPVATTASEKRKEVVNEDTSDRERSGSAMDAPAGSEGEDLDATQDQRTEMPEQEQEQDAPPMDDITSNESLEAESTAPVTPAAEEDAIMTASGGSPAKESSMSKLAAFKFSASIAPTISESDAEAEM